MKRGSKILIRLKYMQIAAYMSSAVLTVGLSNE